MHIEQSTLQFLKSLKVNNNREWFNDHKNEYQAAKQNMEEFMGAVIQAVRKLDSSIEEQDPKKAIFRIFRDVRFSKNKEPYKTNFGGVVAKGGRKSSFPAYYIHIHPENESFAGGGLYCPEGKILQSVRQEIDYNQEKFAKLFESKAYKDTFGELWQEDKLKRPPKGYDTEHPMIEYLKMKSFVSTHALSNKEITSPDVIKTIEKTFKVLKPINEFFMGPVEDIVTA